jgi:cystathionine gamma-synthase
VLEKRGSCGELCMLFPMASAANECNIHLQRYANRSGTDFRTIHLAIEDCAHPLQIYAVFFPADTWKVAKSFWQHAGMGVSSRYAEACLSRVSKMVVSQQQPGVDRELVRIIGISHFLILLNRILPE